MPDDQTLTWRKSSFSGSNGGNCIEVADLGDDGRAVRDSKDPAGPALRFTTGEWASFVMGVQAGDFTSHLPPAP